MTMSDIDLVNKSVENNINNNNTENKNGDLVKPKAAETTGDLPTLKGNF